MNIIGKTVKIYLTSGMSIEGILSSIEDNQIILTNQSNDIIIINNNTNNIICMKIYHKSPTEKMYEIKKQMEQYINKPPVTDNYHYELPNFTQRNIINNPRKKNN